MDIQEFLLARIAEDEAVARDEDDDYADTTLLPTYDSEHQANWNTARVLRECAAKRAIIEQAAKATEDRESVIQEFCVGTKETTEAYATDPGKLILESLAAIYSDHPDYQQEWSF